jgi:uncharacterized protein YndB with AHSA1/START domain
MTQSSTDQVRKEITLRAPRSRVWRALTNAEEFGTWFRAKLDGEFVAGKPITGRITHPGYEHLKMEVWVEKIVPEELFSLRWHPHAIEPDKDYSSEPTTLVEFRLADVDGGGTRLSVVESGFDQIPAERREIAFRMNGEGWAAQMENIARHVDG